MDPNNRVIKRLWCSFFPILLLGSRLTYPKKNEQTSVFDYPGMYTERKKETQGKFYP